MKIMMVSRKTLVELLTARLVSPKVLLLLSGLFSIVGGACGGADFDGLIVN